MEWAVTAVTKALRGIPRHSSGPISKSWWQQFHLLHDILPLWWLEAFNIFFVQALTLNGCVKVPADITADTVDIFEISTNFLFLIFQDLTTNL